MRFSGHCLLLLLLSAACRLQAQESRAALMDSAVAAFQRHDTVRTIECLETYTKTYPTDWLNWMANVRLADFYKRKGPVDSVLAKLMLAQERAFVSWKEGDFRPFDSAFDRMIHSRMIWARGNVSAELGDLYTKMGNLPMAMSCLKNADSLYRRYNSGCANDLFNWLSFLSMKYADLYTKMGDTTTAIRHLFAYCFTGEHYSRPATIQLRELLLTRYSPEQIRRTLRKSIRHCYYTTREETFGPQRYYHVNMFGCEPWSYSDSRKELRALFAQSENFSILLYGSPSRAAVGK